MKTKLFTSGTFTRLSLLLFITLFSAISCSKKDDNVTPPKEPVKDTSGFDAKLEDLPNFKQPEEIPEPQVVKKTDPIRDTNDTTAECYTTTYKAGPGFNELLTLDPTTDVIYPGAMLKGESIPTGEYIPIVADRAPMTLSASLTNISGSPVVKIDSPKLSTVREGIKSILNQKVTGATAAKVSFEIKNVYSEEQLNLAIGVNYKGAGKKVSAAFDFKSKTKKNKFVLKYLQTYYTIDMDLPKSPSDLFATLPDVSKLGSTAPVFVSSVAYGRMVLYTVETNRSKTEIEAAFSASVAKADGNIDAKHKKVLNESSIKALIIGGSGGDAAQVVNGPKKIYEFISKGGNYSKDSPGAPLAYKLRYIKKGTPIAQVVLTSEYPVRTCETGVHQKYAIQLYGLKCKDNDGEAGQVELYGKMQGKLVKNNKTVKTVTWQRNESNLLKVDEDFFYKIEKTIEVEVYRPNMQKDYISLYAKFTEDDGKTGDDYLGTRTMKIFLKDVKKTKGKYIRLDLQDDPGSDMRTYFYAWRLY